MGHPAGHSCFHGNQTSRSEVYRYRFLVDRYHISHGNKCKLQVSQNAVWESWKLVKRHHPKVGEVAKAATALEISLCACEESGIRILRRHHQRLTTWKTKYHCRKLSRVIVVWGRHFQAKKRAYLLWLQKGPNLLFSSQSSQAVPLKLAWQMQVPFPIILSTH